MALARRPCGVDVVTAAKAFDLGSSAPGGSLRVSASLVGTDEVLPTFAAIPLTGDGVVLETLEINLDGFDDLRIEGGEDRQSRRGQVGVWGLHIRNAQVREIIYGAERGGREGKGGQHANRCRGVHGNLVLVEEFGEGGEVESRGVVGIRIVLHRIVRGNAKQSPNLKVPILVLVGIEWNAPLREDL